MSVPILYSYFRSSASTRVRTALYLKGVAFELRAVNLLKGEQLGGDYTGVNPMGELPSLVVAGPDGAPATLAQSVAILEYLEEVYPEPPLLPSNPIARARVRQLVEIVNSSIQPVQNLKVLKKVSEELGADKVAWGRYWIARGFDGLEPVIAQTAGAYAYGDAVTLADVVLAPQVYNARRFGCDMARYPTIARVTDAALALDAFQRAQPEVQPDTPPELRPA